MPDQVVNVERIVQEFFVILLASENIVEAGNVANNTGYFNKLTSCSELSTANKHISYSCIREMVGKNDHLKSIKHGSPFIVFTKVCR